MELNSSALPLTLLGVGGLAEYGECEGRSVDPNSNSCYLGNDDIEADVNHRLGILEEVLFTLRCVMFLHTSYSHSQCCLLPNKDHGFCT